MPRGFAGALGVAFPAPNHPKHPFMVASLIAVSAIGCFAIFWILNPPQRTHWQWDFEGAEKQMELMALKHFSVPRFNRMCREWSYAQKFMNRQAEELSQHYWQVKSVLQAHPQLRGYYAEQLGIRRVQLADQLEVWLTKGMALREPNRRVPVDGWSPQSVDAVPNLLDYAPSAPTAVGAGMLLLGATVAFLNRGYDLPKLQQLLANEEQGRAFLENAALEEARHYQLQQLIFHAHPDIRFHHLQTFQQESQRLQRVVESLFPPAPKGPVALWLDSLDPEILRLLSDFGLLSAAAAGYMLFNYLLPNWLRPKRRTKTEEAKPTTLPDLPASVVMPTPVIPTPAGVAAAVSGSTAVETTETTETTETAETVETREVRETKEVTEGSVFFTAPLAPEAPTATPASGVSPTNPPTVDPQPSTSPTQTKK
jgi:hypothetical protein